MGWWEEMVRIRCVGEMPVCWEIGEAPVWCVEWASLQDNRRDREGAVGREYGPMTCDKVERTLLLERVYWSLERA